jgi:hypothetical protein
MARDRRTAEERYRDGDCTGCGEPLEDLELASGYERCEDCAIARRPALSDPERPATWNALYRRATEDIGRGTGPAK